MWTAVDTTIIAIIMRISHHRFILNMNFYKWFSVLWLRKCSKQHVISTLFISYIFTHCSTHLSFYLSILRLSTSPQTGHCNICLSIVVSIGGSKGLERISLSTADSHNANSSEPGSFGQLKDKLIIFGVNMQNISFCVSVHRKWIVWPAVFQVSCTATV